MTATATLTDPLTSLDFHTTPQCEHGSHNDPMWQHNHNGPATHYAQIIHDCPNGSGAGRVYPCCQPFANYVLGKQDKAWTCPECRECQPGYKMARIIATIEGNTE